MSDVGELSVVRVSVDTTACDGPTVGETDGISMTHSTIDAAPDAAADADAILADAAVARSEALGGVIRASDAVCVVSDASADAATTARTLRRAVNDGWDDFPVPAGEFARLDALADTDFDDPTLRAHLRGMTTTARECVDARAGFIGLVEERHETFLTGKGVDLSDRERGRAVCAHGITDDGAFVVDDLATSDRGGTVTADLDFYAGAPLVAGGERIGMLCVADDGGDGFDETDTQVLERLAEQTSRYIDRYGTS
ncbi:GAF domain-containing protein [Halarchaeum salinum]|uniref:GAF domain-containing protein n=1 Tax=Halarchaeum salinum TaxID=489912 RepID=A0AAV3S5A2_9EURY